MKLIEDWLRLAEKSVGELRLYSSKLSPGTAEGQAVAFQIVELSEIIEETKREGFFVDRASSCYLIKVLTREHLNLEEKVVDGIGYLFDVASRAIRLGPSKADSILKINGSDQVGVVNDGAAPHRD